MSPENRTAAWVVALVGAIVVGGAGLGRSLVLQNAESARRTAAVMGAQAQQIERLGDKLDALDLAVRSSMGARGGEGRGATAAVLSAEQLDRVSAAVASKVAESNAPPPLPPPSAESVAALESGQQIVRAALTTQRWTEANAQELRALLPDLTLEGRMDLQRQIGMAINEGKLAPSFRGPPF